MGANLVDIRDGERSPLPPLSTPDDTLHRDTPADRVAAIYDLIETARPAWHANASCRVDNPSDWMVAQWDFKKAQRLIKICAQCPTIGQCLRQGLAESTRDRTHGPFRIVSKVRWRQLRKIAAEVDPQTDQDYELIAAMAADGELDLRRQNAA